MMSLAKDIANNYVGDPKPKLDAYLPSAYTSIIDERNEFRGVNMTTITATAPATAAPAATDFRAWLRSVGAQLRRAFELSGLPYTNGSMPPL